MENYKNEGQKMSEALRELRVSLNESLELAEVQPTSIEKVSKILDGLFERWQFCAEREVHEDIYDIASGTINQLINALNIMKRDGPTKEEKELFLSLRYTIWQAVYRIKDWPWPPRNINTLGIEEG